jgi:alpha-beta hydrolase superfamily lysophospholipase
MNISEFSVEAAGRKVTCRLGAPDDDVRAPEPGLVLFFGGEREDGFADPEGNGMAAHRFVEAGHFAACIDLPGFGEAVDEHGTGIRAMCAAFIGGDDPFERVISQAKEVISTCRQRYLKDAGRVVTLGVSRGAYYALRLTAEDQRIDGVAGIAPVTDWRILQEFAEVRERTDVAGLALTNWASRLAGRSVYLAIGNHDHRVGTHTCTNLAHTILASERPEEEGASKLNLHVVDSPGHTLDKSWREKGVRFLLEVVGC